MSKPKDKIMKARYRYSDDVDDQFGFTIEVLIEDTSEQKDFIYESFYNYFNHDDADSSLSPFELEVFSIADGLVDHYRKCRKPNLKKGGVQ